MKPDPYEQEFRNRMDHYKIYAMTAICLGASVEEACRIGEAACKKRDRERKRK